MASSYIPAGSTCYTVMEQEHEQTFKQKISGFCLEHEKAIDILLWFIIFSIIAIGWIYSELIHI